MLVNYIQHGTRMSTVVQIADAVVAELNAGTFTESFTAERLFSPVFDLQDMQTLRVSVMPRSVTTQPASRSAGFFDYAIDIGVQKKLNSEDSAEVEGHLALVEQISDYLRNRKLTAMPDAFWTKTENNPVYVPEHLDQLRQFTSVLTVTYRIMR
jgi:hypothetical protein